MDENMDGAWIISPYEPRGSLRQYVESNRVERTERLLLVSTLEIGIYPSTEELLHT